VVRFRKAQHTTSTPGLYAEALPFEVLQVPPLLPEHLISQPVQIVAQSSPEWQVWVGSGATLLGAAIGAGVGGWVAYKGTLKANLSLVNRSKLEECQALLLQMQRLNRDELGQVINELRTGDHLTAKAFIQELEPDQIEHVANRIHALIRLHARELESEADRMASRAKWVSDLYQKINISLSAPPDAVKNWHETGRELQRAIRTRCNDMENYILERASTEQLGLLTRWWRKLRKAVCRARNLTLEKWRR